MGDCSPREGFGAEQKKLLLLWAETAVRVLSHTSSLGSRRKKPQVPPEAIWCRLCVASRILAWGWSPRWSDGPKLMHWVGWEPGMQAGPSGLEGLCG